MSGGGGAGGAVKGGAPEPVAKDQEKATIAGIVNKVTVKNTRNNQIMAFLTIEDMTGEVEVIVFPREYERYRMLFVKEKKLLISGRVSHEEDKDAKLIASDIVCFDERPRMLWVKFATMEDYRAQEKELLSIIDGYDGPDGVTIYIADGNRMKTLPPSHSTLAGESLVARLKDRFGDGAIMVEDA